MFAGHLALALAARRVEPCLPLRAAVAGAFGLDLRWPMFLLLGIERLRVHPGDTASTNLAFGSYPWSHNLLFAALWAVLAAAAGRALWGSWRAGGLPGGSCSATGCSISSRTVPTSRSGPGGRSPGSAWGTRCRERSWSREARSPPGHGRTCGRGAR